MRSLAALLLVSNVCTSLLDRVTLGYEAGLSLAAWPRSFLTLRGLEMLAASMFHSPATHSRHKLEHYPHKSELGPGKYP